MNNFEPKAKEAEFLRRLAKTFNVAIMTAQKNTKKSEQIAAKIAELEKEFEIAKKEESKVRILDDKKNEKDEIIGFFNLTQFKFLLGLLHNKKILLLEHQCYGEFVVYMNPQQNRILVEDFNESDKNGINEGNILEFMTHDIFKNWYILNDYEIPD